MKVDLTIGEYSRLRTTHQGLLLYNRHDIPIGACLTNTGEYCYEEARFLDNLIKPGWTVVEAGAHIGTHTVSISKRAKMVYAYEPQRGCFHMLCANLALNECLNVEAVRCAIGREDSSIIVPLLDPNVRNNTGGVILRDYKEGDTVSLRSLDSIGIDFDLLKADVETMELEVVRGAAKLIEKNHPALYLESNEDSGPLIELVQSMGYRTWWHFPQVWRKDNLDGNENPIFDRGIIASNLVALHESCDVESQLLPAVPELAWHESIKRAAEKEAA